MPEEHVPIAISVEIIQQLLQIAMPVTSRILLQLQILIILHPDFPQFVLNVTVPIRDGSLPLTTIPFSPLRLGMPDEPAQIVIQAAIIHRHPTIAMPATSRILLLLQILIIFHPDFQQFVLNVILPIRDGSLQLSTIPLSLLPLATPEERVLIVILGEITPRLLRIVMAVIRLTIIILSIQIIEHWRFQLPVPSVILLIPVGRRLHIPSMILNTSRSIADGIRAGGIHVPNVTQMLQTMHCLIASPAIRMYIVEKITPMHNVMNVTPGGLQIESSY
jgi:hypothetical protein